MITTIPEIGEMAHIDGFGEAARVAGRYDYEADKCRCPVCGGIGAPWFAWFSCYQCPAIALIDGGPCFLPVETNSDNRSQGRNKERLRMKETQAQQTDDKIDISGHDKESVLMALYDASKPQGLGLLAFDATPMTREQATECLNAGTYFDYLQGRVMKVDLSNDSFSPRFYDRDNGPGAAQRAVDRIAKS